MNSSAPTRGAPARDTALLIAEARPARRAGTEPMSAVDSGATRIERPNPKTSWPGRTSTRYPVEGMSDAESDGTATQGALSPGIRANQSAPADITSAPAAGDKRGPRP